MDHLDTNAIRMFSPVALSKEASRLWRLCAATICTTAGGILNSFFVASFFVEPSLNKIGNEFLACVGMSDMIISMTVFPTSSLVLLSGEYDTDPVCHALQCLAQAATYSYSLFFAMAAMESYYRICRATWNFKIFISVRIKLVALILFAISFLTAITGVYLELDYDYCRRQHTGNFSFRMTTSVIFYVIPFLVTCYCLLRNSCRIRKKARKHGRYRRSQQYELDATTNNVNIAAYCLFVACWVPCIIIVYIYPYASDSAYYHSVVIGICRSVVTSFVYDTMDRNFRRGFAHLFNYCFCKNTLSGSNASRHRRALQYRCTRGDVRVHILHQAVNANSPRRGASSSRETQEL